MAEIIWLDPATFDLEEIIEYIAFDNPEAAGRVSARIFRHLRQLSEHPESGSIPLELPHSEYRQIVEPPCRIFYKFKDGTVFIAHVVRSGAHLTDEPVGKYRMIRLENTE